MILPSFLLASFLISGLATAMFKCNCFCNIPVESISQQYQWGSVCLFMHCSFRKKECSRLTQRVFFKKRKNESLVLEESLQFWYVEPMLWLWKISSSVPVMITERISEWCWEIFLHEEPLSATTRSSIRQLYIQHECFKGQSSNRKTNQHGTF